MEKEKVRKTKKKKTEKKLKKYQKKTYRKQNDGLRLVQRNAWKSRRKQTGAKSYREMAETRNDLELREEWQVGKEIERELRRG